MSGFSLPDIFHTRLCDAHIIARDLVSKISSKKPIDLAKDIIPEIEARLSIEND